MLLVFFVLIFPPAAAGTEHFVLRSDNSNFILTDVTADKHFINIRMTLEVSPASLLFSPLKSLGLSYPCFIFLPPLQVQHHHLSFSTPTFLYICSFFSSSLGPYQPTMHWSHVIPSPYHLLTVHYSTLSPPPQKSLLRSHSYYTIPLTFSPRPPHLLSSRHRHRPLATFPIFIVLLIPLIISNGICMCWMYCTL